jgi:hypothetical protein
MKPETTKPRIVKCPTCGNQYGSKAKHECLLVLIDQVTTDYTIVKLIGFNHEKFAEQLVRMAK